MNPQQKFDFLFRGLIWHEINVAKCGTNSSYHTSAGTISRFNLQRAVAQYKDWIDDLIQKNPEVRGYAVKRMVSR